MEVRWLSYPGYRHGECGTCGVRSNVLTLLLVMPIPRGGSFGAGSTHLLKPRTLCASRTMCRARVAKRTARQRLRRGTLFVLVEPAAPKAPRGMCKWCGGEITSSDGRGIDRRRNYHYGPWGRASLTGRPPQPDEDDCAFWFHHWRTMDSRVALMRDAESVGRTILRCADCRAEVARQGPAGARPAGVWFDLRPWEADHEMPLEDGGEHCLENLAVRCAPCHRSKTGRENAARAAARRVARS